MHTSTISDQSDHGTLICYDGIGPNEYLNDSDSYNNNDSDCESDDYKFHRSNYKSDSEEAPCISTSTTVTPSFQLPIVQEQKSNETYTLRQEKDMSNDKGLLDYLPIYSFLFPNEKGSCLYNAYDHNEVEDKLVIKIDQDGDRAPKFSVADDISEVYDLPRIHECINGQKPLRPVIDINASKENMEIASVKGQEVFIQICCSFIRALYQILDCGWEDILKGLIIATLLDSSKCSYHILYTLALLIDHQELKAFTELVYTLTGKKFSKYIDQELPGQNFNLCLIGLAKKGRPPTSLGLEVRPQMLSKEKNNNPLRIIVSQDVLQKYANLVLQKHSNYLRDWIIEEKDSENFVYFNQKGPLECSLCKHIHDKDQWWFSHVYASSGTFIVKCFQQGSDEPEEVFEYDPSIAEKIRQENKKSSSSPSIPKIKGPATETYEERYVRPLPDEEDIYVGSP
ncbi:12880_t:CDS:2 [Cetraspora pellucida]|uniref:12880_t:CDS:1 n=1 Tax=Cetraspora pellucida TaxID=1433469 RepID=A0ACA9L7W4_9GLOM|nr:12880_t:CDS:2 [Cetraspora pellucida]